MALYASISDELKLSEPLESAKTTDPVLDLVETFFFPCNIYTHELPYYIGAWTWFPEDSV